MLYSRVEKLELGQLALALPRRNHPFCCRGWAEYSRRVLGLLFYHDHGFPLGDAVSFGFARWEAFKDALGFVHGLDGLLHQDRGVAASGVSFRSVFCQVHCSAVELQGVLSLCLFAHRVSEPTPASQVIQPQTRAILRWKPATGSVPSTISGRVRTTGANPGA